MLVRSFRLFHRGLRAGRRLGSASTQTATKTSALDMGKADFRLLRELASKVPWESAFEGSGVHQCWSDFKHCLLKAQDQAIPKYRKSSRRGRRPAWRTGDLLLELRWKKKMYSCWKEGQVTWKEYRDAVRVCREKTRVAKAQLELKLAKSAGTIKRFSLGICMEKGGPKKT